MSDTFKFFNNGLAHWGKVAFRDEEETSSPLPGLF